MQLEPSLPRISIVTPSYNYGRYLEQALQSVRQQRYPNLEHMVFDGGSRDDSVAILQRHSSSLSYWASEPDGGAVDAIMKGLRRSSGELFNWLNADDYLFAGTLLALGTIATAYPEFDIYAFISAGSGECGAVTTWFGAWPDQHFNLLSRRSVFGQESTFVRREFLLANNVVLRDSFQSLFDTALYEEMLAHEARVLFINVLGGVIRHHGQAKTTHGPSAAELRAWEEWEGQVFSPRQRLWRRFNRTRLHRAQRLLCRSRSLRQLIGGLAGLSSQPFTLCHFIGSDPCDPAAWRIETR